MGAALLLGVGVVALLAALSSQARADAGPRPRRSGRKKNPAQTSSVATPYARLSKRPLVAFSYKHIKRKSKKDPTKEIVLTYVTEKPSDLKAKTEAVIGRPVADDAFIIATVISSEVAGLHPLAGVGVGHAIRNAARASKKTISEQVLSPSKGFASQVVNAFASTRQPPSLFSLAIAEDVLADRVADPTGGAVQWDSPRTQDAMHAKGDPLHRSSAEIAQDRKDHGKEVVYLADIDPRSLRFWRPAVRNKELVS